MKYIKTITIDISKKIYETIETKSKDTARYLLFKILDNGVPLDLTSKTVRAYSSANKFNNLVVVSAKDGLCELKLTTEFLGAPGLIHVELTIYEGLETLSSMVFCINNMACLRDDAAIEATNEFSALTIALNKVEALDKNLNMASTDLEKKYTARLNGIDEQLEDNALNSIEVDASLTKLNSVVDGNVIIDKIQGRTLLNLSEKQDEVKTVSVNYAQFFNICELSRLELNTDYTLIITVKNTFSSSKGYHGYIGAGKIDSYAYDLTPGNGLSFISSNTGVTATKFKITQQELDKGGTHLAIRPSIPDSTPVTYPYEVSLSNVMVLKGDYTQKPPSYFKGIKSVGEDNQNKIEVITHGKNLFDKTKVTLNKYVSDASGELADTHDANASDFIPILPNTEYIIFSPNEVKRWGAIYDVNKQYIKGVTYYNTFTTPSNARYFRCTVLKDNMDTYQLEEKQATNYEPYKEDESEISLASPLKEKDYIDKNGVHRKSLLIRLGTESWIVKDLGNGYVYAETQRYDNLIKSNTDVIACNKLPYKRTFNGMSNLTQQAICSVYTSSKLRVNLLKSNLETIDSDGINKYLKSIEVIVLLETISETIEPINESLILSSFKDGYFGLSSGAINPVVSLRFPTNIGERVTGVEESTIYLRNRYYESLKVQLQLLAKNIELETNKQNKTDSTLTTASKEVVAAINENKAAIETLKTNKEEILVKEIGENDCYIKYKDGCIYQSGVVLCDTNNEIYINFKHPFTTKCLFANGTSIWQTGCEGTGATNLVTIPSTTTLTFVNPGNKRKLMWEAFGI